jgi:hypothetical protein
MPDGAKSPVKGFLMRGRSYFDYRPIKYSDMDLKIENYAYFGERKSYIGFRVVVEPR